MSVPATSRSEKKPFYYSLTFQLILGLALGSATGIFWPDLGASLNPLATAFVKLIKMVAGLIVFLTVVTGFARMKQGAGVGKTGILAIVYFEVISSIALLIGIALGNIFEPGSELHLHSTAEHTAQPTAHPLSAVNFIMGIIPNTVVDALSSGIMLQILLISVLFGYGLFAMGERAKPVIEVMRLFTEATFKVVNMILKLAPIGVFGAAAYMLGKYGIASLLPLLKLVGLVYMGCFLLILLVFSIVAKLTKFNLLHFIYFVREELIIAFTTTSSEAALPGLMKKLQQSGCSMETVGFVVPTGYSLNLDGSSIYMTISALFIAQAAGVHMGLAEQFSLLLVFLLTSKGVAGVTGGAFVTLSASLLMFPNIPLEGLALILGVDRLMDTIRTMTNVLGNGIATMAISYWKKERQGFSSIEPASSSKETQQYL